MSKKLKSKHSYKIIHEYVTNSLGWECDQKGWVVEKDGKIGVVETSHGAELNIQFEMEAIKQLMFWKNEYEAHLATIEEALKLIRDK